MALSTHEILHRLERNAPVIRRYGVRSLGLFGSAARGAAREDSDLDFVVEFETKSFDAYLDLKAFLERLFGCPVDLVLREAIKPRLRETILRCMNGYGLCLWRLGRRDEAARVFDRMLWMNPADNQGIRFLLPAVRDGKRWEESVS